MVAVNERRFNRLAIAALIASFALLTAAFFVSVRQSLITEEASSKVEHSFEVMSTLGVLDTNAERAETAVRGWLVKEDERRVTAFHRYSSQILPTFNALQELTADNPRQVKALRTLKPDLIYQLTLLEGVMDKAEAGDAAGARTLFLAGLERETLARIRTQTDAIRSEERRLLEGRRQAQGKTLTALRSILAATGALLGLVSLATFFLVRRYTRDLLSSRARLHVLNTNLEGAVAERTSDLKRANDEIQRFAYIVSHDLRSPLVNVMGFTAELETTDKLLERFVDDLDEKQPDLVAEPVRLAVKEDLPEAIGFIRTSTAKMDRLINAILSLSRQGRRVLSPQSLDMNQVVGEIATSLAALAEERGTEISIEGKLPMIEHDRLAIDQIFSNLIENATKYGQPGRPGFVRVRGKAVNGRAIFEIEDNGRGVAPQDHERIFDLFRRAGSQDQRGEGIGLANVRALAYRLGGTVSIRSALGQGSTFIVDLPIAQAVDGEDAE